MTASAGSSRKELESAWMVLRLAMRSAAKGYAPRQLERMNAFGAQPVDPASVEPVARKLNEILVGEAGAGEASPTMRFLKNTFRPSEAEKERRNLEKAFNGYLAVWQKQKA